MKSVHPSSISSLATFALLLDLAGSVPSFSGTITTQLCFTYTLEGITAMPRGLHARLCHAFIVFEINLWENHVRIYWTYFRQIFTYGRYLVVDYGLMTDLTSFSGGSWDIAMATNFRVKIGEIGLFTFIRSHGISKRSAISPFWFLKFHLWWRGYIVLKFGELRSSNSGV